MEQPLSWKLIYAGVIILLIGLVAFGVTQFTGNNSQRWDDEELTPQKFKSSLEKEKALLSSQMRDKDKGAGQLSIDAKTSMDSNSKDDHTADSGNQASDDNAIATEKASSDSHNNLQKQIEPLPLITSRLQIQFKINSNEIDTVSYIVLDRIAAYLIDNSSENVLVRGYTDSVGSDSYNESISRFRASAVKSYLVGKGVNSNNITVLAMGSQNPIATNQTLEGRQKNRRVEIEIPSNRLKNN